MFSHGFATQNCFSHLPLLVVLFLDRDSSHSIGKCPVCLFVLVLGLFAVSFTVIGRYGTHSNHLQFMYSVDHSPICLLTVNPYVQFFKQCPALIYNGCPSESIVGLNMLVLSCAVIISNLN